MEFAKLITGIIDAEHELTDEEESEWSKLKVNYPGFGNTLTVIDGSGVSHLLTIKTVKGK